MIIHSYIFFLHHFTGGDLEMNEWFIYIFFTFFLKLTSGESEVWV